MKGYVEKLKKLFLDPKGRIPRKPFIISFFSLLLLSPLTYFFLLWILPKFIEGLFSVSFVVLLNYVFAVIHIKRLHDLNRTGWFYLLFYIPGFNFLLWIYLGFFKGSDEINQYGPPTNK